MMRIWPVNSTVEAAGFDDVAPAELAENEGGDETGIDAGDGGGLGRREHAAIDAAEDDDRGAQRPQAAAGGMEEVV